MFISFHKSQLPTLLLTSADERPYQRSYLYDRSHLLVGRTEGRECFLKKCYVKMSTWSPLLLLTGRSLVK
jgi:hypothetical protein